MSADYGLPAPPQLAQKRSLWYWTEDDDRLAAHNAAEVFQPGNFVKYAGSVCAELEEKWTAYQDGSGPSRCGVNLTDRIASTGTEQKAFARESGVNFDIDFASMQQINRRTGYARQIMRQEVEIPQAPVN